jgi:hypothetical protein
MKAIKYKILYIVPVPLVKKLRFLQFLFHNADFRDGAEFEGRPVTFHKRAQILVMDLWCLFAGRVQRLRFQT